MLLYCPCFCFVIKCGLFERKQICACFFIVCLYMYCHWRSSYQEGRDGMPLTSLTPSHFCTCPKPTAGFQTSYVVVFLCSVTSVKMRGDSSFCWYMYWWNWWPSLFKLYFHNHNHCQLDNIKQFLLDTDFKLHCI
jgi:hypothetical protein